MMYIKSVSREPDTVRRALGIPPPGGKSQGLGHTILQIPHPKGQHHVQTSDPNIPVLEGGLFLNTLSLRVFFLLRTHGALKMKEIRFLNRPQETHSGSSRFEEFDPVL